MAYRELSDPAGREWRVWDTHPESASRIAVPEEFARGWLTFESPPEKRRLVPIPHDWWLASDGELLAMASTAAPVPGRTVRA